MFLACAGCKHIIARRPPGRTRDCFRPLGGSRALMNQFEEPVLVCRCGFHNTLLRGSVSDSDVTGRVGPPLELEKREVG